jgi:YegS/Rv2252/BmrU family lipid kinase
MRTFLVVNPKSANGQTGKHWPEISARASGVLGTFAHAFTEGPMDAARLSRNALREGYECVVAVGGDGTVSEVANGFFDGDKVINPKAALGVIPRGTGGDFRRTFSWGTGLDESLNRLKTDAVRPLDMGQLDFCDARGERQLRYFVNICSFGVSGQVDHEVNRSSKALGGKLSFMLGSVKALLKYSDRKVRIAVDDQAEQEVTVTTLAVANGRYFGGGMCVAPAADPHDGLFDVTLWTGYGLTDFALKSKAIYDGSHIKLPGTRTMRCKKLRAESAEEVLLDVDGEQPGRLPCSMTVLPSAIQLKV